MKNQSPSVDQGHLADHELATLVLEPEPEPRIVAHLSSCRRCMAAYSELVHAHAQTFTPTAAESLPPDWLERSLEAGPKPRRHPGIAFLPRWTPPALAGIAVAAVCIMAGSWLADRGRIEDDHRRLARRMRYDSFGGPLYGESFLPEKSGVRGETPDAAGDVALADLVRRSRGVPESADQAFWLVAGFLSHNDLDNADAWLRASRDFGKDPRLLNLEAILAYKRNDLARAEAAIEEAVQGERTPSNLYNLALVRRASGDEAGGLALLHEIMQRFPGTPVASLAGELTQAD